MGEIVEAGTPEFSGLSTRIYITWLNPASNDTALAIQIEYNDPAGPLTPAHILEAYRRYKLKVTSGMGSHPRLGMGLVGGGGAGSGVAGVRKRGPFGGS